MNLSIKNIIWWSKRKFFQIKNIIRWFPVLWKTTYWDYGCLIDIFLFQLGNMKKHFESKNTVSSCARIHAGKMNTIINLMKKVYDEEYAYEYMNQMEKLYGKSKFVFHIKEDYNENSQKQTIHEPYQKYEIPYTESQLADIEKHRFQLLKQSLEKQNKAHKLLWKLIEHNIRGWWD